MTLSPIWLKVEPSRGKKTSTSQLDIGSFPLITNFQNIRHKTMPTTNLMRKKVRWSRIPDPAFPENNSYQTKNLRWKALGLAIDNMKIPYLDHQCRNQLRPCQSEVHGTWAKVVKQTTQRVFSKRAGLPCSLLTYPSTYRISTSTLLLKSCSYMCKSQRLKSQEPVAGWALKILKILNSSKNTSFLNIHWKNNEYLNCCYVFSTRGKPFGWCPTQLRGGSWVKNQWKP